MRRKKIIDWLPNSTGKLTQLGGKQLKGLAGQLGLPSTLTQDCRMFEIFSWTAVMTSNSGVNMIMMCHNNVWLDSWDSMCQLINIALRCKYFGE